MWDLLCKIRNSQLLTSQKTPGTGGKEDKHWSVFRQLYCKEVFPVCELALASVLVLLIVTRFLETDDSHELHTTNIIQHTVSSTSEYVCRLSKVQFRNRNEYFIDLQAINILFCRLYTRHVINCIFKQEHYKQNKFYLRELVKKLSVHTWLTLDSVHLRHSHEYVLHWCKLRAYYACIYTFMCIHKDWDCISTHA